MPIEQWVALIGGSAGFLSLFLTLLFWLFPSKVGAGDRFMGWLFTYGPLWPVTRVCYSRKLDRLTTLLRPRPSYIELEGHLDTLWERLALLAPVLEKHPSWFAKGYFDTEGVEHPHNRRFLEFRIAWCLFWRGESYGKFRTRLRDSERSHR